MEKDKNYTRRTLKRPVRKKDQETKDKEKEDKIAAEKAGFIESSTSDFYDDDLD